MICLLKNVFISFWFGEGGNYFWGFFGEEFKVWSFEFTCDN